MPAPIERTALRQTYAREVAPGGAKDIYGAGWRAFQGISDSGGGLDEIQDNSAGYSRARLVESYIFRAQDVRGSAIDSVPLRVWTTDERGRKSAVPHPALEVLKQNTPVDPAFDPFVTGASSLMRYVLLSLDGHGRSAWRLAFNGKGLPSEIYYMPPQGFRPLHGFEVRQNAPFGGLQYSEGGEYKRLKPEEVVYFQTDNPDDPIVGTSKVSILRDAINLRMYSVRSNRDFFKNSMRPDWVLTGEWKNNEENVERIKRALRRHYSGESNREPLVLGEGAKAQLLTTSQKDAEWQAMMRIVQEEISAIYGVPVVYLNNMERATYQNIETAKLMLWHDTMMPETKKLAAMLTQRFLYRFWPDTRAKGLEFGFDYNTVTGLNEDVARIWERFNALIDRVSKQVETRQMTPNQARMQMASMAEALGLDPAPWQGRLDDGDVFYLPFNNIPTNQLGVQEIINIEAARSSNPAAPELIENVPGAEHAADNAQRAMARQERMQQAQADAQAQASRASAAKQRQFANIRRALTGKAEAPSQPFQPTVVVKAPNPTPIRDNRLSPIQKRLAAKLKSQFQAQQRDSLRTLRGEKALKALPPDVDSLYDREASKVAIRGLVRVGVSESAQAAYGASREDYSLDVSLPAESAFIDAHMGKRIQFIDGIDDTTADALRDTLSKGAAEGETMDQLADRVSAVFSDAIGNRAETIARTETINAYAAASLQSYADAGVTQAQMYDGSGDPECAAVNGMIVTLAEAERLMADEHPNGTRGVAPVVDLGFAQVAAGHEAIGFGFDIDGVVVA